MVGSARKTVLTPLLFALLGVALILILLYGSLQRDLQRADRLDDAIAHGIDVREALADIVALHTELESGKNGYAIAGNARLLGAYPDRLARLEPAIQRLSMLESRNKAGSGYARLIAAASEDHAAHCRSIVALIEQGRGTEARALITSGAGKAAMDRLHNVVAALQSEEQVQLHGHQAEAADMRARVNETLRRILLALGILMLGGGFASAQIIRSQANRIETDSNLFNAVIDPIILLSRHGEILSSNRAAQHQFGYSADELAGTSVAVLLAEWPDEDRLSRGLQRVLNSSPHTGLLRDYLFRRRNGTRFRGNASVSIGEVGDGTTLIAIIRPHLSLQQLAGFTGDAETPARAPGKSAPIDLLDTLRARIDTPDLQQRRERHRESES